MEAVKSQRGFASWAGNSASLILQILRRLLSAAEVEITHVEKSHK
jgi:hypothetical protein